MALPISIAIGAILLMPLCNPLYNPSKMNLGISLTLSKPLIQSSILFLELSNSLLMSLNTFCTVSEFLTQSAIAVPA